MLKNNFFIFFLLFIYSCQQVEFIDEIVFDYDQLNKITVSVQQKNISDLYESKYGDTYIDHSLSKPPVVFLNKWLTKNIYIVGNQNILEINIIEASLKKSEINNNDIKKYKEKTIFLFEARYLVEFILYDDDYSVLASSIVEANRTTTSGKYISIQENEKIINYLIFNCLDDFSKKAKELIKIHLKNYVL